MGGNAMADGDDQPTGDDTNPDQQQDGNVNDQDQTRPNNDADTQQDNQDQQSDKDKEPDWKAEATKWKTLARKHESKVKELSPLAAKLKEIEDSQKSEIDKIKEREQALQVELQGYRVAEIRRAAASAAGLDSELAEFITAVDEEEAKAQAERLAERFKATAKQQQSADFKQGTRTTPPAPQSRDDLLRALAGHGRR
jgi:hypothetical protein